MITTSVVFEDYKIQTQNKYVERWIVTRNVYINNIAEPGTWAIRVTESYTYMYTPGKY